MPAWRPCFCDHRTLLKKARVHPIQLLSALKVYEQGHGDKGSLKWTPDRSVVDALNDAFYLSFETIEPTGKNILLALDVSGSMDGGVIAGVPGLTPRIAAAAMAMVTARVEKNWHVVGFSSPGAADARGRGMSAGFRGYGGRWGGGSSGITPIDISPKQRLDDVVRTMQAIPMGGTDCALPMLYAMQEKLDVDAFFVYTDNETWAGDVHPFQALKQYRAKQGKPNAKLCVVGMTATEFTIADPSDAGMLDFVGMDSAAPSIMSDFVRGG